MLRRSITVTVAATVVLLVAAACGGGDDPTVVPTQRPSPPVVPTAPTQATATPVAEETTAVGVCRRAVTGRHLRRSPAVSEPGIHHRHCSAGSGGRCRTPPKTTTRLLVRACRYWVSERLEGERRRHVAFSTRCDTSSFQALPKVSDVKDWALSATP